MLLLGEITLPDSQISVFEALTRNLSIILDEKVWQFKAVKFLSCRKEHSSASVKKQDQNSLLISVISLQILQRDYVSLNIYLRNMQLKTNCFFAPKGHLICSLVLFPTLPPNVPATNIWCVKWSLIYLCSFWLILRALSLLFIKNIRNL